MPDSLISFTGFRTIWADRDTKASGKQKGGGLILLVYNWCNPNRATIKEQICNKDIELLAVSFLVTIPYHHHTYRGSTAWWLPLLFTYPHCVWRHTTIVGLQSTQRHSLMCLEIATMSLSLRLCPHSSSLLTLQQEAIKLWTSCMQMFRMHTNELHYPPLVDQTMIWSTSLPLIFQLSRGCLPQPEHLETGTLRLRKP